MHIDSCSIALYHQKEFAFISSVPYPCIHMCTTAHTTSSEVYPAPPLPQAEPAQGPPCPPACPLHFHGNSPLDSLLYVRVYPVSGAQAWTIRTVLPMPNEGSGSFPLVVQPQVHKLFNYLGSLLCPDNMLVPGSSGLFWRTTLSHQPHLVLFQGWVQFSSVAFSLRQIFL